MTSRLTAARRLFIDQSKSIPISFTTVVWSRHATALFHTWKRTRCVTRLNNGSEGDKVSLFPKLICLFEDNDKKKPTICCGFFTVELIRSTGDEDGQYDKLLEEKTNKEDLVAIFDSLNFLGGCAWRTNKRILDLAIHMFNNGGNEDLAVPGPVIQPEVDSISSK